MAIQIVTGQLKNDAVTQAKIGDDAVGADQLAASAVVTASIVDSNITTAKIADLNVTAGKIANQTITSGQMAMGGGFAFTGALTSAATPSGSTDVANKAYVDTVAQGLHFKDSVRAATTAAGTLASSFANGQAIDGVTLSTGNRILIKNQAAAAENGVYTVNASGAPTRSTDMDAGSEFPGAAFFVKEGSTNADSGWVCTNDTNPTLGSTSIAFSQFTGAGQLSAGSGISISGNTISVATGGISDAMLADGVATGLAGNGLSASSGVLALDLDGSTLSNSASGVKVADGGIANAQINASAAIAYSKLSLTGSVTSNDLAGSIANSKLANDGITIAGADTSLGGSISADTIAGQISSATLTLAQLANAAANTVLVRDANSSGVLSAKAVGNTQLLIGDGTGFTAAALSGDVTMSNAGVATIADNAVSLAKMAGLARGSVIVGDASGDPSALAKGASGRLLQSDGTDVSYVAMSGDATIASGGALTIADNAVSLAKMAGLTRGNIIIGDVSGDPSGLSPGTAAQMLQSNGTDVAYVSLSGDVTIAAGGAVSIGAQKVVNSMIADDAVGADELAASAVVTASIVDNAVTLAKCGFTPAVESFTGDGSAVAFTLNASHRIPTADSAFYAGVMVWRNGLLMTALQSGAEDIDEYVVGDSGSATTVTFGTAPLAGDMIVVRWLY